MSSALSAFFRAWWVRLTVRTHPTLSSRPLTDRVETDDTPSRGAPVAMAQEAAPKNEASSGADALSAPVCADAVTTPASAESVAVDPVLRGRTLETLRQLQQIPALQSLAQGFLRAAGRTDGSVDEVVASVEKDPALCVRVLRMANSALVRPEQRIEDIFTAVQMLGLRRVGSLAHALFTMHDSRNMAGGVDWRHLWVHALATAAIAEELDRKLGGVAGQQLYLSALLHDVGKIVLATVAPEAYRIVLAEVWNEGARLDELELRHFGVGHSEAGAIFGRQSGLPDEVIAAIECHADPARAERHRQTVAIVSIANYLSKSYGLGFSGARLNETDGELESLPGWAVLAEDGGATPEVDLLAEDMARFITGLKPELQGLREAA